MRTTERLPKNTTDPQTDACWLVLIHQLPPKPDYLRVRVGRQLRRLGAVPIKNSVYVLPVGAEARGALAGVAREIHQTGGEAAVCEARFVEGLSDGAVEDLFRKARDADYAAIGHQAKRLASDLRGRRVTDEAQRRPAAQKLERLKRRFDEVVALDPFGARGRETVAGLLSLLEDRIQGVELAGEQGAKPFEPPQASTWVTRTGVMVDRIASAWLIRRFIDPAARFKFVSARGFRPQPGEFRFDMAGAEFTHAGARCTFEVLVDRFRLRDSALEPIAEIVHDLDLEDAKYGRPETAGVERMIVGLAIAKKSDEVRLEQGSAVFDNLYQSFKKRSR